jgi:catechol 2,3-dioxygenase-like lactoylglutathione lyase family enzyme
MLDHIGIAVSDVAASIAFYEKALGPLGYKVLMHFPQAAGFGRDGKPDFWIGQGATGGHAHIAFATDRKAVDGFHAAAIAAGGTDNGPPGIRAHYHPNYYGAFVKDPDGHNIEAVCHTAPGAKAAAKKPAAKRRAAKATAAKKPAAKRPAAKKSAKKGGKAKKG